MFIFDMCIQFYYHDFSHFFCFKCSFFLSLLLLYHKLPLSLTFSYIYIDYDYDDDDENDNVDDIGNYANDIKNYDNNDFLSSFLSHLTFFNAEEEEKNYHRKFVEIIFISFAFQFSSFTVELGGEKNRRKLFY